MSGQVFNSSRLDTAGRGPRDQPGHRQSAGGGAAEAVPHVRRGAGQVSAGQHAGRLLGGHPPQGHPEDIRRQSSRHPRRPEEEPGRFCSDRAEKVSAELKTSCFVPFVRFDTKACKSPGFQP